MTQSWYKLEQIANSTQVVNIMQSRVNISTPRLVYIITLYSVHYKTFQSLSARLEVVLQPKLHQRDYVKKRSDSLQKQ